MLVDTVDFRQEVGMANRVERAAFWRAHVEGWRESALTQAAYCAEQGVSAKSLAYWLRRFRREGLAQSEPLTLVAVRPIVAAEPVSRSNPALSLHSCAGWHLEFGALPSAAWLAELLAQGTGR